MIKIILLAYLLLINIITYFTYAADKTKARQNKWRIPERTLILLALLGGSPAALLAMKHCHHKTRHLKFKLGIPIILIIQIVITYFPYLKYLIPQHSRLTGAVCPLFTILQISPQHQPWQPAQADGWSFDNLERLADRNKVHHFP